MAYVLAVPLLAMLAIFQSTILSHLHLLDGAPDLVLLATVGWSLVGKPQEAMIWGFVGGLSLDLLSGVPFGVSAISLILIAFLVSLSADRFWEAHPLMPLGAALAASILYHLAGLGIILILGRSIDLETAITRVVLPSTFLNLLLVLPIVQLAGGIRRGLYPPEVEI